MSIDKSKLPPPLAKLLADLEASGVNVEVITGSMPPELKRLLGIKDEPSSRPSSTDLPDGYPPFAEFLDKLAGVMAGVSKDGLTRLHDHLCPQVKKLTDENKRQQEINDSLFGELRRVTEQLSLTAQQTERQKGEILELSQIVADLRESHRKQIGLLHRRVTKRKGEIKVVKAKSAATKGRVTKLARQVQDHSAD